jgi:hypothetical protein
MYFSIILLILFINVTLFFIIKKIKDKNIEI